MSPDGGEPLPAESAVTFRAKALAEFSRGYSPWLHFTVPSLFGIVVAVLSISQLSDLRFLEALVVPALVVAFNGVEWVAHRDFLHVRRPFATVLYDRHTPVHHRVFVETDMAIRDVREFGMVLIPAFGIILIAVVVAPIAAGIAWAGQRNVACLFVATSMLYAVSYEWLHLAYHAPRDSFVARLPLMARLRRHHATHHRPRLMQKHNFNVTLPLFDWLCGTTYRGDKDR